MRLTLITITLNAQSKLSRCISSVLTQTRLPDEYIFVDGGSQDGTLDIIEKAMPDFASRGVDAKLLKQVHKEGHAGIPEAWNQGIEQSTGDIIALLNSDDLYSPEAMETVANAFSQDASLELLSSPIKLFNAEGKHLGCLYPHCLFLSEVKMPLPHPGTFMSASLYRRIGLYNENYSISADYDFVWRCRKAKVKMMYIDSPLASMEIGGRENSSRELARKETLEIALRHSSLPMLAKIAYLLRKMTGR